MRGFAREFEKLYKKVCWVCEKVYCLCEGM